MNKIKLGLLTLVSVLVLASCERIDAGNVGLKINMSGGDRGVSNIKYVTGWVWYTPGATKVVELPVLENATLLNSNMPAEECAKRAIPVVPKSPHPLAT